MSLEKTLEVFKKRTPEEKQQYIYKLVRENNQLRNENERLNKQLKDANELHAKLWASISFNLYKHINTLKKQKEAIRDCKFNLIYFEKQRDI